MGLLSGSGFFRPKQAPVHEAAENELVAREERLGLSLKPATGYSQALIPPTASDYISKEISLVALLTAKEEVGNSPRTGRTAREETGVGQEGSLPPDRIA